MSDAPPLDRLTPPTAAEVRRNALLGLGGIAALFAVFLVAIELLLGTAGREQAGGVVALALLGGTAAIVLPLAAVLWALAVPLAAWPGMLRPSFVASTWGVDSAAVAAARHRDRPQLLRAATRGAAVGAAGFLVVVAGLALARGRVTGGGVIPFVMLIVAGGQIAGRAWQVRAAVAEKAAAPPAPPLP